MASCKKPSAQTASSCGRTTSFYQTYSRYGVSDQGLNLGGCGVSGQDDAGTRQYAEKAILRGTTCVYYMHEVGPEGSINIGTAPLYDFRAMGFVHT